MGRRLVDNNWLQCKTKDSCGRAHAQALKQANIPLSLKPHTMRKALIIVRKGLAFKPKLTANPANVPRGKTCSNRKFLPRLWISSLQG